MAVMAQPEGFRQHRYSAPSGATRILLVRHGESEPAVRGVKFPLVDGHADPALHPDGELQALAVGERLAQRDDIAAIYVTTLRRTHQTAAPLAARIGLEPEVIADLREVHLGDWEGGELRWRAADGDPIFLQVIAERRWDAIPGAEPEESFNKRLQNGLATIAERHPDQTVVAVVHGGVIGQILAHATGTDPFTFSGAENASISEIVVLGDVQIVRRFNDVAHLEP